MLRHPDTTRKYVPAASLACTWLCSVLQVSSLHVTAPFAAVTFVPRSSWRKSSVSNEAPKVSAYTTVGAARVKR